MDAANRTPKKVQGSYRMITYPFLSWKTTLVIIRCRPCLLPSTILWKRMPRQEHHIFTESPSAATFAAVSNSMETSPSPERSYLLSHQAFCFSAYRALGTVFRGQAASDRPRRLGSVSRRSLQSFFSSRSGLPLGQSRQWLSGHRLLA